MRDKPRGGGFWVASIWIEVGLVVDAMHSISSSAIVMRNVVNSNGTTTVISTYYLYFTTLLPIRLENPPKICPERTWTTPQRD